jgi:hypothetical protein
MALRAHGGQWIGSSSAATYFPLSTIGQPLTGGMSSELAGPVWGTSCFPRIYLFQDYIRKCLRFFLPAVPAEFFCHVRKIFLSMAYWSGVFPSRHERWDQ